MLSRLSISRRFFYPRKDFKPSLTGNRCLDIFLELKVITNARGGVDPDRYRDIVQKGADFLQASKDNAEQINPATLKMMNCELAESFKSLQRPTPEVRAIFSHYGNTLLYLINLPAFRKVLRAQFDLERRLTFYGDLSRDLEVFCNNMKPLSRHNKQAISNFYKGIGIMAGQVASNTSEDALKNKITLINDCWNLQRVEKLQLAFNFNQQGQCLFSPIARILKEDPEILDKLDGFQMSQIVNFYTATQRGNRYKELINALLRKFTADIDEAYFADLGRFIHAISRRHLLTNGAVQIRSFFKNEVDADKFAESLMKGVRRAWELYRSMRVKTYLLTMDSLLANLCELRIVPISFFSEAIDFMCEEYEGRPRYELHQMRHLVFAYRGFLKIGLGNHLSEATESKENYKQLMTYVEEWKYNNDKGNKLVFNNLFNWAQRQANEFQPSVNPKVIHLFKKGITHLANRLGDIEDIDVVKNGRLSPTQIAFIQDYKQFCAFYYMMADFPEVKKQLDEMNDQFGDPISTGLQQVMYLQGIQNRKAQWKQGPRKARNFEQRVIRYIELAFQDPKFKELHPNLKLVTEVPTESTYEVDLVVCEKDALTGLNDSDHEDYFLRKKHIAFEIDGSSHFYEFLTPDDKKKPHPLGKTLLRDHILRNMGLTCSSIQHYKYVGQDGILYDKLREDFLKKVASSFS